MTQQSAAHSSMSRWILWSTFLALRATLAGCTQPEIFQLVMGMIWVLTHVLLAQYPVGAQDRSLSQHINGITYGMPSKVEEAKAEGYHLTHFALLAHCPRTRRSSPTPAGAVDPETGLFIQTVPDIEHQDLPDGEEITVELQQAAEEDQPRDDVGYVPTCRPTPGPCYRPRSGERHLLVRLGHAFEGGPLAAIHEDSGTYVAPGRFSLGTSRAVFLPLF